MDIERLRALEKKWRDESASGFDGDGNLSDTWTAQAMRSCADELATLIAELGQEVGAVADERLCDFFADVGEVEQFMDDLCNVVTELTGDEGEDDPITVLRRYIASSPAHTSEARDAAAKFVERVESVASFLVGYGEAAEVAASGLRGALFDYDAAMRQEGGK